MKRVIVVWFCPGCGDFTLHLGHAGEEPSPVCVQEIPETAGSVGAGPGPFSPESPGEVTHPAAGPVPVWKGKLHTPDSLNNWLSN